MSEDGRQEGRGSGSLPLNMDGGRGCGERTGSKATQ